jgi:KipI family sensor histidine kinase inhibitor
MKNREWSVVPVGDSAVLVVCGNEIGDASFQAVTLALTRLRDHSAELPVTEWVPSYTTVLGRIDGRKWSATEVARQVSSTLQSELDDESKSDGQLNVQGEQRVVEIPVVYGGEYGPDLEHIAVSRGMTGNEFVRRHASAVYRVYLIGFVPGFPYLGGLPPELETPRRREPRARVPAGSVGIGGKQTGIYPADTPGGWQLIGRTPLKLFDLGREEVSLLNTGDFVRFLPISEAEYLELSSEHQARHTTSAICSRRPERPDAGLTVVKPGIHTTVQDLGRTGRAAQGVSRAGAMDAFAATAANLIVGNQASDALFESTFTGPELAFHEETTICVTGAPCNPSLNGNPVPMWTAVPVPKGSRLACGGITSGCRVYIAVAGGLVVDRILGSFSTDVGQGFGGYGGRALKAGDWMRIGPARFSPNRLKGRGLPMRFRPEYPTEATVGFIPSQTPSRVSHQVLNQLVAETWTVSPQSNRMGIRFIGPALAPGASQSVISEPVVPGTIQCPPGGTPIVLMAEAQTVGGYPTAGVVCTADLSTLAQAPPASRIRFIPIDEAAARQKLAWQNDLLRWLAWV